MSQPNPQSNSPLVKLPREVRDAIYLEVWRLTGLRQHIVAHWGSSDQDSKPHYCRWKCCTPEFEVEDRLQEEIDQERIRRGITLGEYFSYKPVTPRLDYQGFLSSPWDNHWECWLEITQGYGREYIEGNYGPGGNVVSTSGCRCWRDVAKNPINLTPLWGRGAWRPPTPKPPSRWKRAVEKVKRVKDAIRPPPVIEPPWTGSPYMPMLLCCKLLSPEIVESLYRSTTFIFTDIVAWQLWLGYCDPQTSPRPELREAPRAFLENTRSIELGLHPTFKLQVPCTFSEDDHSEQLHDPYDFHWLNMDRFRNLRSLKIWMSARTLSIFPRQPMHQWRYHRLDQFSKSELIKSLSAFDNLDEFIISTPLAQNIGPEDGYVQDLMENPNHHVWKRGTGDHFHPGMDIDLGGGGPITNITTYPERMVTPATNGLSFSFSFRLQGLI
ncbi:hypothetical protein NCS52_01383700 [Fusarium sp. LHS14.1]|nr:hypothetical protein NCS52_01383700 [Fusarium sp. LHS14.1]